MGTIKSLLYFPLICVLSGNSVGAQVFAEEPVDDLWRVSYITDTSVHASVNGQITHGDELRVRLINEKCEIGNLITFVYTYSNHPDIEQLQGALIPASFMGEDMLVKVLYISPFLMGHRATIDFGWTGVEQLKDILGSANPIKLKFKNSKEHQITDYFDIPENWWSNDGMNAAIDKAVDICQAL